MTISLVRNIVEAIGIIGFLVTRLVSLSKIISANSQERR